MIDISISTHRDDDAIKNMKDLTELKGIVLYCDTSLFTYKDDTAYTLSALTAAFKNSFCSDKGYHFAIDAENIVSCVPDDKKTEHLQGGKNTYINKAMYDNKANEKSISVIIMLPENQSYKSIENKAIKFLSNYLIDNDLEPKCIMREFDLNMIGSPLHLLDESKWNAFIEAVEKTYEYMKEEKDEEYIDKYIEDLSPTYTDEEINKFYVKNGQNAEEYSKSFEPDNRDIEELVNFETDISTSDVDGFVSANKTAFSYAITQNSPGSTSHCARAYDSITTKATPDKALEVEPIYPDLVVPPGGSITLTNNLTSSNIKPLSNVLSLDELEKREKTFNINDYKDAKKIVNGKPVNNNDPYPVDIKIKELESHQPKLKIDEVNSKLHDCNHPGSIIGPAVAKNFAMVQDEIITLAKRTERRMVKVENILATMIRNIFRIGSRMNINCIYYGGQDVYGKYKCIRCLHDDRINDGQSMTLDQCMNCTRYEPILGQVYAILDENATNLSQVLDDIQMAYMTMEEYAQLTRTEEMHSEREYADIQNNPTEQPKTFYEQYQEKYDNEEDAKGFEMNWNETQLENERPNIAEYEIEGMEANKPVIEDENQGTVEAEFKDTITEEEEYETIKYNSEDYNFTNFGTSYSNDIGISNDGYFGMGGAAIRSKIVEYAQNAYDLCQEGKAGYSQDNRYNHLENAINGISYWDCSSLVEGAYKAANISSISGTTYTEYPSCLPTVGGLMFPISKISEEGKAGDIVFFTSQNPKPSTDSELANATISCIGHVGIYNGEGKYIHASTGKGELTQQIKISPVEGWDSRIFAFGRPKELVEADKLASSGEGFLNYEGHGFSETVTNIANKYAQSQAEAVIASLNKYNYASIVIEEANNIGVDPYIVLGLIATESAGDPTDRSGPYWGLMQTPSSQTKATSNLDDIRSDIQVGCSFIVEKQNALGKTLGTNMALVLWAYNAGQLIALNACEAYGEGSASATGGQLEPYVTQAAVNYYGEGKREEVSTYVAKIILRANILQNLNALG